MCLRCIIQHYSKPLHATLRCLYVRCTIRHYAKPFHATLHCLYVRCTIRHYAEPFPQRYTICVCAVPFYITLSHLKQYYTVCAYAMLLDVTLSRLTQRYTILCSNSTWATRPFLIWLNYSCLGCSVSRRKTRLSIIWPCHSFISYAILQLILTPSLYLLIYLTSLYFWW